MEEYKVVIRKEGRSMVYDVYLPNGRLGWKGLSSAGLKDIFEQLAQE